MRINWKQTIAYRFFDREYMWEPVHASSLGVLRILFGILMVVQVFLLEDYLVNYLTQSQYLLHYDFFEWMVNLSPGQMSLLLWIMKLAAAFLALGLFTRYAALVFFLGFTYVFLMDKSHYNNHYYLISLFSFLLIFVNSNRWMSLDKLIPGMKATGVHIPRWHLLAFQLMIFIVYFYGAIAKMNQDWLEGYPMRIWLWQRSQWEVVGPYFAQYWMALVVSYVGLFLDLFMGFMLFSKKNWVKLSALVFLLLPFHISNHFIWNIGIFPYMMIGVTILFFDPRYPDMAARWICKQLKLNYPPPASRPESFAVGKTRKKWGHRLLIGYFAWQFLFPLRVFFYPQPVEWHTIGEHFSWHMMLVDKSEALKLKVLVNGQVLGQVSIEDYLNYRQYLRLVRDPAEIIRFSKFIVSEMKKNGAPNPAINAIYFRSINGRPFQQVFDTTVDVAALNYSPVFIQDWLPEFKDTPKKKTDFNVLSEQEMLDLGFKK